MADGFHRMCRARPVADVPPAALADGTAVAKAWLLELMHAAPLDDAAALPVAELASGGPELCAAVLGAVGSDRDLERLALRGDRAALAASAARLAGARDAASAAAAVALLREVVWTQLSAALAEPDPAGVAALAARVAHVSDVVTQAVLAAPVGTALRDAEEPWLAAVSRALGTPGSEVLSLLVVEAADADRLAASGDRGVGALQQVEEAARAAARRGQAVIRERPGRVWVVAPGLGAEGARVLAGDIAGVVASAGGAHGAPWAVAAGIATCPDDGDDARTLVDLADERLYVAQAAGAPFAP